MKPSISYAVFTLLSLLLLSLSCVRTDSEYPFNTENFRTLEGEPFAFDVELLSPVKLWIVADRLLVSDNHDGQFLTVIPLDTTISPSRMLNKGNGPHEFLKISGVYELPDRGEICIVDGMKKVCSYYLSGSDFNLNDSSFIASASYMDNAEVKSLIPFDGGYIANGCFEDKMFALLGSDFSRKITFGDYPGDCTGAGSIEFFMRNQTHICSDPLQHTFVCAGTYNDWLAFYLMENGRMILQKEYFKCDPEVESFQQKNGNVISSGVSLTERTKKMYDDIFSTDKYVYALYWGIKTDSTGKSNHPCNILKFTHSGDFIGGFRAPELVYDIAVTNDDSTVFALVKSPTGDYAIKKFNLGC